MALEMLTLTGDCNSDSKCWTIWIGGLSVLRTVQFSRASVVLTLTQKTFSTYLSGTSWELQLVSVHVHKCCMCPVHM